MYGYIQSGMEIKKKKASVKKAQRLSRKIL
jgi:hypothetical protein